VVDTPIMLKRPAPPPSHVAAAMLRAEDVAEACLMLLKLPRRAHIPELTILPTRLQSLGKTSVQYPEPPPRLAGRTGDALASPGGGPYGPSAWRIRWLSTVRRR
jgi:hypothetical protein